MHVNDVALVNIPTEVDAQLCVPTMMAPVGAGHSMEGPNPVPVTVRVHPMVEQVLTLVRVGVTSVMEAPVNVDIR